MSVQKRYTVLVFTIMNTKSRPEACRGIVHFANSHPEWNVIFSSSRSPKLLAQDIAEADGFIVTTWPCEAPRKLLQSGKPLVVIDPNVHHRPMPNLCEHFIDNDIIAKAAARHLLSLGHCKSFAFATLDIRTCAREPIFVQERRKAFAAALYAQGFACATIAPGEEALMLTTLTRPIAVFAAHDERAAEIMQAARKLNLHVPRDLVVIGVDNNTIQCESTTPPLSSIEVDFAGSAIQACHELDDLMHNRHVASPCVYHGDILLVSRKSTAAPSRSCRLVTQVLALVREHSTAGLTVAEVASRLGVSRQTLALRVRETTGMTLQELILESRFTKARQLLRQTSLPLKAISDACGFNHQSYFISAFRRRFGKTPSSWRQSDRHLSWPLIPQSLRRG